VLVWTGWKTETLPWRVWWVGVVVSLHFTHLLLLHLARRTAPDRLVRVATVSAVPAAAGFLLLALRRDLLGELPALLLVGGAIPAAVTVVASLLVGWREVRPRASGWRLAAGWRRTLLVASHLAALGAGLYLGRTSAVGPGVPAAMPSALAHLAPEEIRAQTEADLERLRTVVAGLASLEDRMATLQASARESRLEQGRDYFLPEEDDALRWSFVSYLSYRTALLRLVTTYSGSEAVRDPALSARCFTLACAALVTVHRSSLDLVERWGSSRLERRKLNEAEPSWGLPAGMFDRVLESAISERQAERVGEMGAYFESRRGDWRTAGVWPEEDLRFVEDVVGRSLRATRERGGERQRRWLELLVARVRDDAYRPFYTLQSSLATWIGDTRIVERPPLITPADLAAVRPLLEPGDILLERRSWYASNAFLPGFWPHAALYVGTASDLRGLGLDRDPEVARRLEAFAEPAPDGRPHAVIEAVSEGVVFNSLEHSLAADYAAALRPRLDRAARARAIAVAFRHQGKPYDFEFDFFSADRLVCTELVYRSYRDLLRFDLVRVMGRDTLPAIEVVRTFARELGTPGQQLDLVFFLDGDPVRGCAVKGDEAAFIASAERRREFNE
jgi:hypothetical protein